MFGAEAASPQPTVPSAASMRTSRLWACAMVTPAIFMGLSSGSATGMASTRRTIKGARSTRDSCSPTLASILTARNHAHEHAIFPDEMVLQRRPDMADQEKGERDADEAVHHHHLIGERAILAPDVRQLEEAEPRDRRRIGRRSDPAGKPLDHQQRVERPMQAFRRDLLDVRNVRW